MPIGKLKKVIRVYSSLLKHRLSGFGRKNTHYWSDNNEAKSLKWPNWEERQWKFDVFGATAFWGQYFTLKTRILQLYLNMLLNEINELLVTIPSIERINSGIWISRNRLDRADRIYPNKFLIHVQKKFDEQIQRRHESKSRESCRSAYFKFSKCVCHNYLLL